MQVPVKLEPEEWKRLLTLLANIKEAWVITNPLIVKINNQVEQQDVAVQPPHKGNNDEREISARPKAR